MAIVGGFGPVLFEVSQDLVRTWRSLSRQRKARYQTHEVTDGKQRLQHVGLELDTVDLSVFFDARYVDPSAELQRLDEILEAARPRTLLLGDRVEGRFVLESFTETRKHTDGLGLILFTEVSLKLKEYH